MVTITSIWQYLRCPVQSASQINLQQAQAALFNNSSLVCDRLHFLDTSIHQQLSN
jgi:hypothetical protein